MHDLIWVLNGEKKEFLENLQPHVCHSVGVGV